MVALDLSCNPRNVEVRSGRRLLGWAANSSSHGDGNAVRPAIESGTHSVSFPPSAALVAVLKDCRSAERFRSRKPSGSSPTGGKKDPPTLKSECAFGHADDIHALERQASD